MKPGKKPLLAGVVLLGAAYLAYAGGPQSATVATLEPTETIPVEGPSLAAISGFPRCDLDGDIFIRQPRLYGMKGQPGLVRVSADGEHTTLFSPSAVADPDLKGGSFGDFAVALDGEVYALAANRHSQAYVVEFKDNGEFYSATQLAAPSFYALHLAVFPSGEFLVAGVKPGPKGEGTGAPVTAIFDASGKMVKELALAGDVSPGKSSATSATDLDSSTGSAVGLGGAVPSKDGNIYLERSGASGALVYVISPSGEVVRRLELAPPGKGFRPGLVNISGGDLIVEFFVPADPNQTARDTGPGTFIYSVFDPLTGKRLMNYGESSKIDGWFACANPNYFTFAGAHNGRSYIIHAVPK